MNKFKSNLKYGFMCTVVTNLQLTEQLTFFLTLSKAHSKDIAVLLYAY